MRALASDSLVKNEPEQGYVMAQHNADQVADWNGQSGERWVVHQARLDARLAVFGQAAIEAAAPATGGRLHRYRYRALRCFRPVWRGRDAGRGDRRRGEDDV